MENGTRLTKRTASTGVAVAVSHEPQTAFQLMEIVMNFNTAPTTSENVTITATNADSDVYTIYSFDPSAVSGTSYAVLFDQRFEEDITIGVAYTNTDARNIVTNVVYQLDEKVRTGDI